MLHDLRPFEEWRTGKGSAKRERIEGDLRGIITLEVWGLFFLQEEEKRKIAQKEAEDERKKKHIKEEYQREKVTLSSKPGGAERLKTFWSENQRAGDPKRIMNLFQVRQNIRDKYGIEKKQPTKKSDKQTAAMMEELRKEYGMDDEDAKELQNKMDKVIHSWWGASTKYKI